MSITGVTDFYQSAHLRCALKEKPPDPRTVQEFIQAWREIRKGEVTLYRFCTNDCQNERSVRY